MLLVIHYLAAYVNFCLSANFSVEEVSPGPGNTPLPTNGVVRAIPLSPNPSAGADPAAEREAYTIANALYAGGKFSEAVPLLQAFLNRFPNSAERHEIQYKLGDALRRTGEEKAAVEIFQTILEKQKDSPYAPFSAMRLAEIRMAGGDMAGSLSLLDAAIAAAPTTGLRLNAIYSKIIALQALDRLAETPDLLDQLTAVRENNPYLSFAELALGRYHESISDNDAALRHYNRALAQSTSHDIRAEAGTRAAVLAMRQNQYAEAIRLFDTTLRLEPPEKWRQLCQIGLLRAYAAAGEHESFLKCWDTFELKIPPGLEAEFLFHRATALRCVSPQNRSSARQLLMQIIENHPESPYFEHATYEMLLIRMSENEPPEQIIPFLRNFLAKYNDSFHTPTIRYLLACSLMTVGKQSEALPLLLENIKSGSPKDLLPQMRIQAAIGLMAAQRHAEALIHLQEVLKVNPEGTIAESALQLKAMAQEGLDLYDEALATWDTLTTRFPNTTHRPLALYRTGLIHAKANRWPETRRAMRSLLSLAPDFDEAHEALFWKGVAAYHEGDHQEASADLKRIVETSRQNDPLLPSALQHLLLIAAKDQDIKSADSLARKCLELSQAGHQVSLPPPAFLFWLASSCEKLSQHADAEYWFEKLLPLAEEKNLKTLTLLGLARTRIAQNRAEKALENIEALLEHDNTLSGSPEILLLQSRALLFVGRPQEAKQKAEKVLSETREPELSARARVLLGDTHAAMNELQEALKYYTSAGLLYDDPEVTPEALKKSASTAKLLGLSSEAGRFEKELKERYKQPVAPGL